MIDIDLVIKSIPESGRVLITCENGDVTSIRIVAENEHVTTFNALIDLAKLAGYNIVSSNGNTL
ncbi:hypothetical protein H2Y56_05990 [Pectobacterium aroidearum]|uniref:Phage protein n=1 Tax=Pectobacterium aroidearum TaxID=1201031 RepID=A0ABR5ZAR1_9GAMM|nr:MULTISPECIES: hypothetical protein [Pectobacterium]MBA5198877.1 hypothetical protein [Pectobacterium aroidearum]MBA5231669.1 hypothetical protein [Pectobacterium aroidearum]MBA5736847.1 hypothetical protein [Pectobacterium aroidearum]UXJ98906.1 hypothetical protein N5056_13855 [Pectobacterium aroidearum]GKV93540.1 hypothetical protein PEC301645_09870 [Pectobacterium carotovorum subsp. carotovorum]